MKKHIERKYWTLIVITSSKSGGVTPVQLQKTLFLVGQKFKDTVSEDYYSFKPYDYGPFSSEIYGDIEALQKENFIVAVPSKSGRWRKYSATQVGKEKFAQLLSEISEEIVDFIDEKINHFQSISFKEILQEIYKEYPKYSEKSVFQDA